MSKSGIRLLSLVAVSGVVVVGALGMLGARVSERARRRHGVFVSAEEPGRVDRPSHGRTMADEERAIAAASAPAASAPSSPALLPTIARQEFAAGMRSLEAAAATAPVPTAASGRRGRAVEPHGDAGDPRRLVLKKQLEGVLARHPDVALAFVNCEAPDCRARVEARDLRTLKAFVDDAAAVASTMKVRVEMVPSAFNGTSYRADWEGPPPAAGPGGG